MVTEDSMSPQDLCVLDLFCGAGGLSTGFSQAGYTISSGIDTDTRFLKTWNENHTGQSINLDLTESSLNTIQQKRPQSDKPTIIIGGPPCKDFSNLNRTVDLGRNHLVLLFAEYVNALSPTVFVMENVRQLVTQKTDIKKQFLNTLNDKYIISYRTLDSADYGVPQHRIRTFFVGIDKSLDTKFQFPTPTHGPDSNTDATIIPSGEALTGLIQSIEADSYQITSKHSDLVPDIPPGLNYSFYTQKLGHPNPQFEWRSKFSDYLYKANPYKPVRTIKAKPGAASGPFHWNNRRFTESELKRLQGFPDGFQFPQQNYTVTHEMIGNSVPPRQAYILARAIYEQISAGDSQMSVLSPDDSLGFISRRRTSSQEYQQKAKQRIQELYGTTQ